MPVHKFFGFGVYFSAIATMLMGLMEYEPGGRTAQQHYAVAVAICLVATALFTVMTVWPAVAVYARLTGTVPEEAWRRGWWVPPRILMFDTPHYVQRSRKRHLF